MLNSIIEIGKWKKDPLDLKAAYFPQNLVLSYEDSNKQIELDKNIGLSGKIFDMRKSAECHRQVRRYIQPLLKPGVTYKEICDKLEAKTVELFGGNNLKKGVGFYTSWSVNNVAAHDSAIPNDKRVLHYDDVLKLDFGTHVNGYITDCAFTVAFNPKYKPLIDSTKEATWAAIKMAGPDVRINDISKKIKEVIESYEMELNGKMIPIKSIRNLGGHNIKQYQIHGGDIILCSPSHHVGDMKMSSDTCYAIETFASTGNGFVTNDNDAHCSHYMKKMNAPATSLKLKVSKKLLAHINKNRGTLPFCTRFLEDTFNGNYKVALNELTKKGMLNTYPPLVDIEGSYSSQLEHTIYLHEKGKEILSFGEDY